MNQQLIILDFDGVLVDSVDEVAVTAYNAITGELCSSFAELPKGYPELFRRFRYHVQPAGDFLPYAQWCLDSCATESSVEFSHDDLVALLMTVDEPVAARGERFFAARARLIERDKTAWLKLNKPYQPLWDTIQSLGEKPPILTNKNRQGVMELLAFYELDIVANRIFTGDKGVTKIENMQRISELFPASKYIFIDDSVHNLQELKVNVPKEISLELCHADWGYVGPHDRVTCEAHSFRQLSQEAVCSLVCQ